MYPALPLSPTERRLKNGRLACHAHSLSRCSTCDLDFAQLNYDDDDYDFGGRREYLSLRNGYDDDEPEDWKKEETRPLQGFAARFMPVCGVQLSASGDPLSVEYQDHCRLVKPDSLSADNLHICPICQLTWFVGPMGPAAASSHPSHHTLCDTLLGTERSLVVYTDGSCLQRVGNGSIIGVGVFFQDDSKFNISEPFIMDPGIVATVQKAALHAIFCALQTVRSRVVPERIEHIENVGYGRSEEAKRSFTDFRLVVVTDLAYAISSMCRDLPTWTWDAQRRIYIRSSGSSVKHSRALRRIAKEVEALAWIGVQVAYYRIYRQKNSKADLLAYEGFSKGIAIGMAMGGFATS